MWPMCSANNPMWLLLPFLLGLATAWWAWSHYEAQAAQTAQPRRRTSSRRLRKARRTMGDPFAHIAPAAPVMPRRDVADGPVVAPVAPVAAPVPPVSQAVAEAPERQEYFQKGAEAVAQKSEAIRAVSARVGADDLLKIKGIGPSLNAMLISLGVSRFDQIASWDEQAIAEIDSHLGAFSGRIHRESWVEQAKLLASGQIEEFERRFGSNT